MEHQLHFKMTLTMRKEPEGGPLFFKVDGQRFRNTRTIKLHVATNYKLEFGFKPQQVLESISIHGGCNLPIEERKCETSCVYTARWSTEGIPPTKKGERDHVPIILKIKDKGTLKMSLQAKYYKPADTHHCEWGNSFGLIEYECNANEHRNHVDIAKETFR